MRYAVAGVFAIVLIGGMFCYERLMLRQADDWAAQNVALTGFQITALNLAHWWAQYWYAGGGLILVVCLARIIHRAS